MTLTDHDRAIRERRIGASEVAAVLGISPYADATPFSVWARITQGYQRPEAPELTAGTYLERAVADWYADQHANGFKLRPGVGVVHDRHDWLSATPDRLVMGPDGPHGLLECKTDRDRDAWGTPGTDQVPVHVAAQVQAQLAVVGFNTCDVAVLFKARDEFACYTVLRDEVVIGHIIRECGAWFDRHVVKGEMPALDGGNAAAAYLRTRYPGGGPLAKANPDQVLMVHEYAALKADIKTATKTADVLKQRIALELGDANGWEGLCTYKPNVKGVRSLRLAGEKE